MELRTIIQTGDLDGLRRVAEESAGKSSGHIATPAALAAADAADEHVDNDGASADDAATSSG